MSHGDSESPTSGPATQQWHVIARPFCSGASVLCVRRWQQRSAPLFHARISPLVAQASRGVFDHRSAKREGGDSVKADKHSSSHTYKEVTMAKRVLLVAIIVAAILVVAAPAMAFNGYRGDYTTSAACQSCHSGTAGIPSVYP